MADLKDPVAAYLKAARFGPARAETPDQQPQQSTVEKTEDIVARYLWISGFRGPYRR